MINKSYFSIFPKLQYLNGKTGGRGEYRTHNLLDTKQLMQVYVPKSSIHKKQIIYMCMAYHVVPGIRLNLEV